MKTKKIVGYSALAVLVLVSTYINRDMFGGSVNAENTTPVAMPAAEVPGQINAAISAPLTPERAIIAQAVTDLAVKIIELSPNQLEAFFSTAEAQSLRLQKIRTQRKELSALEKKADYEAKLYSEKASSAAEEVANSLKPNDEGKSSSKFGPTQYTMSHQGAAREPDQDIKQKSAEPSLSSFKLKSIRKLEDGFRAVISDGGNEYSVSSGYQLPGGVKVEKISAETVMLAVDGKKQTLHVF